MPSGLQMTFDCAHLFLSAGVSSLWLDPQGNCSQDISGSRQMQCPSDSSTSLQISTNVQDLDSKGRAPLIAWRRVDKHRYSRPHTAGAFWGHLGINQSCHRNNPMVARAPTVSQPATLPQRFTVVTCANRNCCTSTH